MMHRLIRIAMMILFLLLAGLLLFPNACNTREYETFSGNERRSGSTILSSEGDSVEAYISRFYDRKQLVHVMLGKHNREMWSMPVKLPLFTGHTDSLQFSAIKIGGGQQTTSIKLEDQYGRHFSLRSVDKDQANALPPPLRRTGIRTLFRDQTAALNPFAAPVAMALARMAGIPNTEARLFFIPEKNSWPDSLQLLLKNRFMLLEIEPDNSWSDSSRFGNAVEIIETDELMERLNSGVQVDRLAYAYCRLFDILIGDWDRHEGQWMWAIDSELIASAIPMDRDMTFYQFDDGIMNKLAVRVNPKFQSFEESFANLHGYLVNGKNIDELLLDGIGSEQWDSLASELQLRLSPAHISQGFSAYPARIQEAYGENHVKILKKRLAKIDSVGRFLYESFGM